MNVQRTVSITLAAGLLLSSLASAQITAPPSGDNQKASVTQHIGPATVTINYSSPDVTSPSGEDRRGKVYGELVHYGYKDEGFGTCTECPWRAGANENTTITFSHDVEVEGEAIVAGTYGLHMLAGEKEWTVIFSTNTSSWGSYFYDASEDALRVTVKPEKAEYRHWLTFDFHDRQPTQTSVRMWWEDLAVPFTISVPNIHEVYLEAMRADLRGQAGFTWSSYATAAGYCLQNQIHLEEAEGWLNAAITTPWLRGRNFTTLSLLVQVQQAQGKSDEAMVTAKELLEIAGSDREKEAAQKMIDGMKG